MGGQRLAAILDRTGHRSTPSRTSRGTTRTGTIRHTGTRIPSSLYGSVRLDIDQKSASVFADGFYVGVVDDFDGIFQHLNLKVGEHHLEIAAGGYETLTFDVNIQAGRTITCRGLMVPILL